MSAQAGVHGNFIPIEGEEDIVKARHRAREVAKSLGFTLIDQSRVATAVSELARNVINYGGGRGDVRVENVEGDRGVGIEVVVSDKGPGIGDVARAMERGYTSGTGLGLGLPGTKRLMDEMEIDTRPGNGTQITIRKWRR